MGFPAQQFRIRICARELPRKPGARMGHPPQRQQGGIWQVLADGRDCLRAFAARAGASVREGAAARIFRANGEAPFVLLGWEFDGVLRRDAVVLGALELCCDLLPDAARAPDRSPAPLKSLAAVLWPVAALPDSLLSDIYPGPLPAPDRTHYGSTDRVCRGRVRLRPADGTETLISLGHSNRRTIATGGSSGDSEQVGRRSGHVQNRVQNREIRLVGRDLPAPEPAVHRLGQPQSSGL